MIDRRETTVKLDKLRYVEAVLHVGWKADSPEYVFWRPDAPDGWRAYAICSDTFAWATADAEEITPEDLPLLQQCLEDLLIVESEYAGVPISDMATPDRNDSVATAYLGALFAARKRKLRPMRCVYGDMNAIGPRTAALFDAAGPEREDPEGKRAYDQKANPA